LKLQTLELKNSVELAYVVMAVGLFGMGTLDGTPMAHLRKTLQPPEAANGSSGCGGGGCCGGCGGGVNL
jgi:hypothetical protein